MIGLCYYVLALVIFVGLFIISAIVGIGFSKLAEKYHWGEYD